MQGSSDSARLDAEVLLRHVTGLDRTELFIALRDTVSEDVRKRFHALVERRAAGVPVAYLTGIREFMGMSFTVTADVLIPRPETELLVEWALALMPRIGHRPIRAVDVGSGSGAIAVSLAALAPEPVAMLAVEPSFSARKVIARNADTLLSSTRRLRFRIDAGDLLTSTVGPFDLVLANLPYLTPEQINGNPDLSAEPRLALDGGQDGFALIERLVEQLPDRTATTCAVGLELDPAQVVRAASLLDEKLSGAEVSIVRDYAGFDRHVVASRLLK